jgi:hypothetical protein
MGKDMGTMLARQTHGGNNNNSNNSNSKVEVVGRKVR